MYWKGFCDAIGTKNAFTAGSVDDNNKFVVQNLMYGNSTIMPIPDLPKADYLVLIGTNPAHTNLSLAKCANVMGKIKEIGKRGKVVIIDPRRNETVQSLQSTPGVNVEHHFIVPSTDTWFLLGFLKSIISNRLISHEFIASHAVGFNTIDEIISNVDISVAAARCSIPVETIDRMAREFATTPRAVIYGRLGTCLGAHPTINAWAIEVANAITGHLDAPGCSIFGYAPFNVAKVGKLIKMGVFDRWRSRIGNHPDVMGAMPLGILAREILTPGKDQIKAFVESGGNIARCVPDTAEIIEAMKHLDIMVNIDFYLNETAVIAAEVSKVPLNYVLPATTPLERENIHLTHLNYNVIPHVEYHGPVIEPPRDGAKPEWEILLALVNKMQLRPFGNKMFAGLQKMLRVTNRRLEPGVLVHLLSVIGNVMNGRVPGISSDAITFSDIKRERILVWACHEYGVLERHLLTKDKKVNLAPAQLVREITTLVTGARTMITKTRSPGHVLLIGRRHLKTMNSWMHNIPALTNESNYPALLVNPHDAARSNLETGDIATVTTSSGSLDLPVEISNTVMEGVACYPHGWGHQIGRYSHASKHPGENYNELTSSTSLEWISGMPRMNGIPAAIKKKD